MKWWYIFQAHAGTRMLENPTKWSNQNEGTCGTHHTAWINGHRPKNPGDLVVRKFQIMQIHIALLTN